MRYEDDPGEVDQHPRPGLEFHVVMAPLQCTKNPREQPGAADADRALTREINANNRSENIQLRMMDSADRRADRNAADRRADRKERQLMILQMIKGIQQGVSSI